MDVENAMSVMYTGYLTIAFFYALFSKDLLDSSMQERFQFSSLQDHF